MWYLKTIFPLVLLFCKIFDHFHSLHLFYFPTLFSCFILFSFILVSLFLFYFYSLDLTLLLFSSYTSFILFLHFFYSLLTLLLFSSYTSFILFLHFSYSLLTLLLFPYSCRWYRVWCSSSRYPSLFSRQETICQEGCIRPLNSIK